MNEIEVGTLTGKSTREVIQPVHCYGPLGSKPALKGLLSREGMGYNTLIERGSRDNRPNTLEYHSNVVSYRVLDDSTATPREERPLAFSSKVSLNCSSF